MDDATPLFQEEFQNRDILVVSKAPGIITQGADSCNNLLACVRAAYNQKVLPVHRLDKGTSGLVVFAKTADAAGQLGTQFEIGAVNKLYVALSDKKPKKKQGKIVGDMAKARNGSWMLMRSKLNPAITQFISSGDVNGLRLFLMMPLTGKTHQLRVVLKSLGAPILGDQRYGGTLADRMYLHAYIMRFSLNGIAYTFRSDAWSGQYFKQTEFIQRLEKYDPLALL